MHFGRRTQPQCRLRDWRPGEPVWEGTIDGELIAVQVRPLANGVALAHARRRHEALRLHRAQAELKR